MDKITQTKKITRKHADGFQSKDTVPPVLKNDEVEELARTWTDMVIGQLMCPSTLIIKTVN